MLQNPSVTTAKFKKMTSLFQFDRELYQLHDQLTVSFFLDALNQLETIYRNYARIPVISSQLLAQIREVQTIYNARGLNFFHWFVCYSLEINQDHLKFLKFFKELGLDFSVLDGRGYHLLDVAIEKNCLVLARWLIEEVQLDIDNERHHIHPIVKLFQTHSLDADTVKLTHLINDYSQAPYSSSKNTPLMLAIRANDGNMVKWLITQGFHVNIKNEGDKTALQFAIMYAEEKVISELIEHGADLNTTDKEGRHVLHYFASAGYLKWIRYYQEKTQVDLRDVVDNDGCSLMFYAVQSSNLELVQYLFAQGLEIYHANFERYSTLLSACKSKTTDILKWLVEEKHIRLFEVLEDGTKAWVMDNLHKQPIHHAASNASMAILKWLIEDLGADINARDKEGSTPLLNVLVGNESDETREMIDYLLANGASQQTRINLSFEEHSEYPELSQNFLLWFSHALIIGRHFDTLFDLMSRDIIDIRQVNHEGQNVFDMVMFMKNALLIERMREFLISYHITHENDVILFKTFLCYPLFVEFLFSNHYISLYQFDPDGDTALHSVAKYGDPEVSVQLMKFLKGANFNFKNGRGESILYLIVQRGDFNFFQMFVSGLSSQIDIHHINADGEHLIDVLKSTGKQEWLDWLCMQLGLQFTLDTLHGLFFEILEHHSYDQIMNYCRQYSSLDFSKTRETDLKKPLAIMLERFSDHEILEFLKEFSYKQILLNLNINKENFIQILRNSKRQDLLKKFIQKPIEHLGVESLLSDVCRKESREVILDLCKTYHMASLNEAVGLKSPLHLIFARQDDELLKRFVVQFYGERLPLEHMDDDGQHFLHYLMSERRGLLNWFCNQKAFPIFPLSDELIFAEVMKVYAERSDWHRYFFKHYLSSVQKIKILDLLLQNHAIPVLIELMKSKILPFDSTDIYEKNILMQVLSEGNTEAFEQLMLNFYIGNPQTEELINSTFAFWKMNPNLLSKEVWIDYMKRTQDKALIKLVIQQLNYDWKQLDATGLNLFDTLYENQQRDSVEWMLKTFQVGLRETQYELYFKEKSIHALKVYLSVFRKIYAAKTMKAVLARFDFDVACAAIEYSNIQDALSLFKDIKEWHYISDSQQSLLHVCVQHERVDLLPFILDKTTEIMNGLDHNKRTALHYAVDKNAEAMVGILLGKPGIELRHHDISLQTVLHSAVRCGLEILVYRVLSECPQLFFAKDASGHTPMGYLRATEEPSLQPMKQSVERFFAKNPLLASVKPVELQKLKGRI